MTNQLVIIKHNEPFTNSLVIAQGTHNQHESVIRLIQKQETRFNRWGKIYFSDFKSGNKNGDLRGRPTKVAFLNEQQATFLITLLKNTDVVLDFKSNLVDEFFKMRQVLLNKQNAEWLENRKQSKLGCKATNDSIKLLVDYAKAHGSTNADKLFITYNKLINKTLGVNPNSRDSLSTFQLHELLKLQAMVANIVKELISKGIEYHQIYLLTKKILNDYSKLALLGQPILV